MRLLWALVKKEFIQIRRDPRTLGIILLAPVVMLVLYGYAVNFDIRHLKTVICDQDQTQTSRELIAGFRHSEYFEISGYEPDPERLLPYLDQGRARAVLWIKPGFGRQIAGGEQAELFLGIDGADSNTATIALGYFSGYIRSYSNKITLARLGTDPLDSGIKRPFQIKQRIWYNPELKSSHFIVPGLISTLLMMMVSLLTAMAVTSEKERNTFEQLAASPMRPWQLILGKIIPYSLASFGGVLLIIPAGVFWFGVPLRGSLITLFIFILIFLVTVLGIGLLISTIAKSQQQAMFMVVSATVLPAVLLSGFIFPIESMPWPLQIITNLVPAKFFLIALRGIFLKGVGLRILWMQALQLLVFAAVLMTAASLKFKKRLD